MKTKRLILALTTWTVVIVMSLHSCQTDSGYDNVIQENNLTEADLFVASEAYKNLEKEIKKNLRRRKNAIDKFSKEEKKQYQQLRKKLSKSDTRVEAQIQLNILLGYDEEASYDRIDSLVWKVYKGTNFTRLELIRARQKRQMNQITISTRDTDSEQRCIAIRMLQMQIWNANIHIMRKFKMLKIVCLIGRNLCIRKGWNI